MKALWFILIFIFYLLFSGIANLFFSHRVNLMAQQKYFQSAVFGAIAVFINVIMIVFSAFISIVNSEWWLIIIFSFVIGIGNFLSGLLVPKLEKKIEKYISKKKERKN